MKNILIQLMLIASLGLIQTGCDLREGTIVYDVDFPRADSDLKEAVATMVEAVVRLQLLSQLQPLTSQKTAEQLLLQESSQKQLLLTP